MIKFLATAAILLSSCTTPPPETLNTITGEWEPAPEGWQCNGKPCSEEQLP